MATNGFGDGQNGGFLDEAPSFWSDALSSFHDLLGTGATEPPDADTLVAAEWRKLLGRTYSMADRHEEAEAAYLQAVVS